jgi:hypothetical protein
MVIWKMSVFRTRWCSCVNFNKNNCCWFQLDFVEHKSKQRGDIVFEKALLESKFGQEKFEYESVTHKRKVSNLRGGHCYIRLHIV